MCNWKNDCYGGNGIVHSIRIQPARTSGRCEIQISWTV